ncbi:hypothetical protein SALBM217S_06488 [Streptomyces griseoloalbus]
MTPAVVGVRVAPTGGCGVAPGWTSSVWRESAYRLFLDFKHDGVVHTAALTVEAAHGH